MILLALSIYIHRIPRNFFQSLWGDACIFHVQTQYFLCLGSYYVDKWFFTPVIRVSVSTENNVSTRIRHQTIDLKTSDFSKHKDSGGKDPRIQVLTAMWPDLNPWNLESLDPKHIKLKTKKPGCQEILFRQPGSPRDLRGKSTENHL